MSVFNAPDFDNHENVIFASDFESGLKCIIGIHNTSLGPALGGCRFWPYHDEQDALTDVLRLSKGMTYKAAMANLPLGGGKAVIIGDPNKLKTPQLLTAYAKVIDRLKGQYITAEDVGTTVADMDHIRKSTPHVRGRSDGTGDPSPLTAFGTYMGIRAAVRHKFKADNLKGIRVAVQGVGHVGYHLCKFLHEDGARIIATDINAKNLQRVEDEFSAQTVSPTAIYSQQAHVYAPCALGATINDQTLGLLKVSIVAGSANNQLATEDHALALKERQILYAPDYVINAGGLINVSYEGKSYDRQKVKQEIAAIHQTLQDIFERADKKNLPTSIIANQMAEERIYASGKLAAE